MERPLNEGVMGVRVGRHLHLLVRIFSSPTPLPLPSPPSAAPKHFTRSTNNAARHHISFQFCCFFSCCSWWLCSFSAPFPFHFATLLCTRTRLKISHSYRVRHCRWFKQGCKPVLNRFNWTEPAASLKGKMNGKLCWIYKVIRNLIII